MQHYAKPPLGCKPTELVLEEQIQSVSSAIARASEAGLLSSKNEKAVRQVRKWIEELSILVVALESLPRSQ